MVVVPLQSNPSSQLLRYFRIRKQWDYGNRESITADDLVFQGEVRSRFASSRFENLYHAWRMDHLSEAEIRSMIGGSDEPHFVGFKAQVVEPVGAANKLERAPR